MKIKNILCLFCIFSISLISCESDQYKKINREYEFLFEKAKNEYKYGKMDKSYVTFLELLSIANNVSNTKENQRIQLIARNYLGTIISNAGGKKLAYEEYEQALKLAENFNNEDYQVQSLLNIAILEEDYRKVEDILYETKLKFGSKKENIKSLYRIKFELGSLYSENNKTEESIKIFKSLLQNEEFDEYLKCEIYKGLGIAYKNNKDYQTSIDFFDKALGLVEDNTFRKLKIQVEIAELYSASKEFKKFNLLIKEIKPTIDTIQDIELKKRINEIQLGVYTQTDNMNGKIEALSKLLSLNEEIYKKSNSALGSIAVNLKNFELKKQIKVEATKVLYLMAILGLGLVVFLLTISFFVLFHRFYRKKTQLEQEQAYKDLENEKILVSMNAYMNGQEEERKQHAAQLHDNLGANLAAVNMHLSLLKKDVPEKKYERISGMLKNVITETRNISHNIMPPLLVNQGVIAAITEKALEWSCPELQFEVESSIEKILLADSLEIALYRGILECVNNIIKSANATNAKIIFEYLENNTLDITIADNGKGFDVGIIDRGEGGLGINGVKNRIKYFKGNFNIESEIGKGTTVHISVPVLKMKQTA